MTNNFTVKRLTFVGPNGQADNISIGLDALKLSPSDNENRNIAIGDYALANSNSSNGSIMIGHFAGANVPGNFSDNIGIGKNVMFYFNQSNSLGRSNNIAIGSFAMSGNGNSSDCIAIGRYALEKVNGVGSSIAIGVQALSGSSNYLNNTGGPNIGLGKNTIQSFTSGYGNIALGQFCLNSLTTGYNNTVVGFYAGAYNTTTGQNNTMIGYYAKASTATVSNEFTLGNSSVTNLRCNDTTISSLSDIRDKKNIQDIPLGLSYINAMRPVMFDWERRDGSFAGKKDFGFIAQELDQLEETFGYREYTRLVHKENPDKWEADPMKTFPILIKAIQELSIEIEKIKEKLQII